MSDQYDEREADMLFNFKEKSVDQLRKCVTQRRCSEAQELLADSVLTAEYIYTTSHAYNSVYEYQVGATSDEVKRRTGDYVLDVCMNKCALAKFCQQGNQKEIDKIAPVKRP